MLFQLKCCTCLTLRCLTSASNFSGLSGSIVPRYSRVPAAATPASASVHAAAAVITNRFIDVSLDLPARRQTSYRTEIRHSVAHPGPQAEPEPPLPPTAARASPQGLDHAAAFAAGRLGRNDVGQGLSVGVGAVKTSGGRREDQRRTPNRAP